MEHIQKAIYTVGNENGYPIFNRLNNDLIQDSEGSPKAGEAFFKFFTEPWMVIEYLKAGEYKESIVLSLDRQEDWDFFSKAARDQGIERAMINSCHHSANHEKLFPIVNTKDFPNLESLIGESKNIKACPICFDKEKFIKENDMEKNIRVIHWGEPSN
jgi:hypothetical protein